MDRWLDNPWVLRGISLLLALLLFSSVPQTDPNRPGDINVPSDENVEQITDVPVKSYYDTENLVVTGVPETVDITIQGPRNIVQQTKALRDFEVFVDLTELGMGDHQIQINIRDISDRLTVTIEPSNITVNIQERVTKEFNVYAEFNANMIADGYIVGVPVVEPKSVQITGAKDVIDQVTYVKATLNIEREAKEQITKDATVLVLDKDMNKLNVKVAPEKVKVTIPIEGSRKTVPIDIVPKGSPPQGVVIESISANVEEATILAEPNVLEKVNRVRLEVDVSKITENTEITLPIIASNGVIHVSPDTAKLSIRVSRQENTEEASQEEDMKNRQESRQENSQQNNSGNNQENSQAEVTLSNLPIVVQGQAEELEVQFINPKNGTTSLTATGGQEIVSSLEPEDFSLSIDVSELSEGQHKVAINVSSSNQVSWRLARETADISILKKEA